MKKITFCLMAVLLFAASNIFAKKTSPYFNRVVAYRPAPGQFINENYPAYATGDNQASMNAKAQTLLTNGNNGIVTLGGFGGYIVLAFDEPIVNVGMAPYDFKVYGNAFANNSEPGIVMVSFDANGNGEADDVWYELAGSEYSRCLKNYEITYTKPNPLNSNVSWTDNQGGSGEIKRNTFHTQASYYPLWLEGESLTFSGTLFHDSLRGKSGQIGYADNVANNSTGCGFKISWAVDANGNSVVLPAIHFVKIYTAVNKSSSGMGEISTEVQYPGIEDLHPQMVYEPAVSANTLNPDKEYHILNTSGMLSSPNTIWSETLHYDLVSDPAESGSIDRTFTKDTFLFHQQTSYSIWGNSWSGVTYSNKTDIITTNYDNQFSAITGRGVDSINSTYMLAYNSNTIEFAEGKDYRIAGTYITNTTVAYFTMKEGNNFAKKFGGVDGTAPDWFKVTFTGIDAAGGTTGNVDFYLADFRSDNAAEDYIVKNWRWVDLSSLGKVAKIQYSFSGSDAGEWGLNTPAYFCFDKMAAEKHNSNADLAWIKSDGNTLDYFSSEKLHYEIHVGNGATTIPFITAQTADSNATFTVTNAIQLTDTFRISVTAEDGITQKLYTITFEKQNANTNLAWIKADNEALANFSSSQFDYVVTLPAGTKQAPAITATAENTNASLDIKQAAQLSDTAIIIVVSQDQSASQTYRISFVVEKSSNADLAWIKVNGIEIANFEAYLFNYTVELPAGTTQIPAITAMSEDQNAKIEISEISALSDTVKINVTSEDGKYVQTCQVSFTVKAAIADLASIQVKVYPNPTQDYLHIEGIENCHISVYDANGRLILAENSTTTSTSTSTVLNSTTWQKGIYFLHLSKNGKTAKSVKIVKE